MNSKKEVIAFMKEHNMLAGIKLSTDTSCIDCYTETIDVFKQWCGYVDYPYTYSSFYEFMREVGDVKIFESTCLVIIFYNNKRNITIYNSTNNFFWNDLAKYMKIILEVTV